MLIHSIHVQQCIQISTRPNSSSVHTYIFVCSPLRVSSIRIYILITGFVDPKCNTNKIIHRKNPAFQCMFKNCGKLLMRKWELTVHIKKHDGKVFKCDTCDFSTNLEKQLKEHQRKHSDDCAYQCKMCNKGFHYPSRLKRHPDHEHKE